MKKSTFKIPKWNELSKRNKIIVVVVGLIILALLTWWVISMMSDNEDDEADVPAPAPPMLWKEGAGIRSAAANARTGYLSNRLLTQQGSITINRKSQNGNIGDISSFTDGGTGQVFTPLGQQTNYTMVGGRLRALANLATFGVLGTGARSSDEWRAAEGSARRACRQASREHCRSIDACKGLGLSDRCKNCKLNYREMCIREGGYDEGGEE